VRCSPAKKKKKVPPDIDRPKYLVPKKKEKRLRVLAKGPVRGGIRSGRKREKCREGKKKHGPGFKSGGGKGGSVVASAMGGGSVCSSRHQM